MKKHTVLNRIPVAISLDSAIASANIKPKKLTRDKKRLFQIAVFSVIIAVAISFIAKILVYLINLFSNIAFHGTFSVEYISPANNELGLFVIAIPVIGGIIVGLMALYGSKAIRGHGIPEAMEQILTNESRIKPAITFLKPLSAAVSIGTGGPFGAEGPIIATGGAFGSTIGQIFKTTPNERKILLAAGATAGMSAIFGSPIAAIFLAIELLLFEFSPRSIIPVALACITGAAGHHLLFEETAVFPMLPLETASNYALAGYSVIGIVIGLIAAAITKLLYFIEDSFEKLPIHWVWWPAIGGVAVGVIGYFYPRTLGVGYENITDILSGTMPLKIVAALCFFKFLSWAIALGSGTSGGTLAPLLTIGGATGALLGSVILMFLPESGVVLPLAALVGMSAMFAGSSRALLTSIIFAVETTGQSNALVPLLAACTASYFISFFLMENTIMTEKIARRGVKTPDSYEPDPLEKIKAEDVMEEEGMVLSAENTVSEIRDWLKAENNYSTNFFIIADNSGAFKGILSASDIHSKTHEGDEFLISILKQNPVSILKTSTLRNAVELMAKKNLDVLPVISNDNTGTVIGILSYKDIMKAYKMRLHETENRIANISVKRRGIKVLLRGQKFLPIRK
ncbi:chloride channel protein [Adhaeribacter terreus]|uniref:Chloride channel protein n=1 Tax=Adhaeribacter terreus TaxID=529703 RepID=A0ABW0E4H0_9BACT